jgi:hypothetical protein
MVKQVKLLLLTLLLTTVAGRVQAQIIDSFHVNGSVSPKELFVRLRFPDSSYYINRTFDRVALIYPPVYVVTFYFRSCDFIKADPVKDTMIPIYLPEPYKINLWLARDSNTIIPGCLFAGEIQAVDSASYVSPPAGTSLQDVDNNALHIFPNPAEGILHVSGAPGCELRVSDGMGRMLLHQKLQNRQETVDISALAPGLYYIHCYRDGQLLHSYCFSKLP